ncbi:MAG: hypothetical protein NVS3B10_00570 [Polyangiales bacterium]
MSQREYDLTDEDKAELRRTGRRNEKGLHRFEVCSLWWESGWRESDDGGNDVPIFCAAVVAEDHDAARQVVIASHDGKSVESWRFVTEKPAGWAPFCERFARGDWMRWPWPEEQKSTP